MATFFDMGILNNFGFPEILLWLLSFALVYGLLSQFGGGMPKSKASRAIIAIVAGFFTLFAATGTNLISTLSEMLGNSIIVVMGILVLVIFLEVAGVKTQGKALTRDEKTGKIIYEHENPVSYFEHHSKEFAIIFIVLAVLVFIGANGLSKIGLGNVNNILGSSNITSIFFVAVIILAVLWMVNSKDEKGG